MARGTHPGEFMGARSFGQGPEVYWDLRRLTPCFRLRERGSTSTRSACCARSERFRTPDGRPDAVRPVAPELGPTGTALAPGRRGLEAPERSNPPPRPKRETAQSMRARRRARLGSKPAATVYERWVSPSRKWRPRLQAQPTSQASAATSKPSTSDRRRSARGKD